MNLPPAGPLQRRGDSLPPRAAEGGLAANRCRRSCGHVAALPTQTCSLVPPLKVCARVNHVIATSSPCRLCLRSWRDGQPPFAHSEMLFSVEKGNELKIIGFTLSLQQFPLLLLILMEAISCSSSLSSVPPLLCRGVTRGNPNTARMLSLSCISSIPQLI